LWPAIPGRPLIRLCGYGIHAIWRHTGAVRITVWVRPGSTRPGVGGERSGALVVRVSARAVGGQATEAALAAVAAAFGVRRRAVTLVAGASSRTKILDVEGAEPATLSRLLDAPGADPGVGAASTGPGSGEGEGAGPGRT
jgi:uncharacterized protein YggU (UPF0235/DUF167 family)